MKMIYNIELVYTDSIIADSPQEALQKASGAIRSDMDLLNYGRWTVEADNEDDDQDETRIP